MQNSACMTCHDNRADDILARLRLIQRQVQRIEPDTSHRHQIKFDINVRCKYGMRCDKFARTNRASELIINEISDKLVAVALDYEQNSILYHNILNLLQGKFPSAYTEMERLRRTSNSSN